VAVKAAITGLAPVKKKNHRQQGCQMVSFQTKKLGKFLLALE
jgi:hypothetical protein